MDVIALRYHFFPRLAQLSSSTPSCVYDSEMYVVGMCSRLSDMSSSGPVLGEPVQSNERRFLQVFVLVAEDRQGASIGGDVVPAKWIAISDARYARGVGNYGQMGCLPSLERPATPPDNEAAGEVT